MLAVNSVALLIIFGYNRMWVTLILELIIKRYGSKQNGHDRRRKIKMAHFARAINVL